jgi:PAT family beta-lactamase induction signal transducer AmpG
MDRPLSPRRLALLTVLLYLGSGLPMGVVAELVPVWLKLQGSSLQLLGLSTLVGLPWTLKALWAPVVDRLGRLTLWAGSALVGVALGVAALPWLGTGPAFWVLLVGVAAASATYDLAADGWAATVAPPAEQGRVNGLRVAAYRAAMLACGGGAVALGGWLPWPAVFALVGGGALLLALPLPAFPSPAPAPSSPAAWIRELWTWVLAQGPLPALALFAFALLFKLGDAAMGPMVKPFWLDVGLSVQELGLVSISLGTGLTVLGALAGGELWRRLGPGPGLWLMGGLQALSNLGYALAATWPSRAAVYGASVVESFTGGLGTAAFLAALMALTGGRQATTRFALLTAVMGLTRTVAGAASGFGAAELGYAAWFALTFVLALPGLLLVGAVGRRLR